MNHQDTIDDSGVLLTDNQFKFIKHLVSGCDFSKTGRSTHGCPEWYTDSLADDFDGVMTPTQIGSMITTLQQKYILQTATFVALKDRTYRKVIRFTMIGLRKLSHMYLTQQPVTVTKPID